MNLYSQFSINKQINKSEIIVTNVNGNVLAITLLKENFKFSFSFIKCLIECKKQKYNENEIDGSNNIKQKTIKKISVKNINFF